MERTNLILIALGLSFLFALLLCKSVYKGSLLLASMILFPSPFFHNVGTVERFVSNVTDSYRKVRTPPEVYNLTKSFSTLKFIY